MYARITPYKMKPGSKAEAMKIMDGLKERILALPGQNQFMNVMNDKDGTGYVISTTTNEVSSDETAKKIAALWGAFKDHLVEQPTPSTYDVVADWHTT